MATPAQKIILVGSGVTAKIQRSLFEQYSALKVAAITAEQQFCSQDNIYGVPLIPMEHLTKYFPDGAYFHVAVGYSQMNETRTRLLQKMKMMGFTPISFISPQAHVSSDATIEAHCHIGDGAVIQPFTRIHENVIILPGAIVGHHTTVLQNSYICQRVTLNGFVSVGKNCFLGAGAVLLDGIAVDSDCFIGAGAHVRNNVPTDSFYNPLSNTVHPNGKKKFLAWYAKREKHYAMSHS